MQINERRPCLLLGGCCAGRAILGGILFCVGLNKRYRKRVFENIPKTLDISGAGEGIRTSDLLITSGLKGENICNKMKTNESYFLVIPAFFKISQFLFVA